MLVLTAICRLQATAHGSLLELGICHSLEIEAGVREGGGKRSHFTKHIVCHLNTENFFFSGRFFSGSKAGASDN